MSETNMLNRPTVDIMRLMVGLCSCICIHSAAAAVPLVAAGKTMQIAQDVYVIPDQRVPLVPNVGIIVGRDGVLVVDTGMGPANAATVLSEVRKITDKPIRYLVSTHFHPEHNFGAQSFPEETTIIYSIAQHEDLKTKGQQYIDLFLQLFGDDVRALLKPVKLISPDITFEHKAVLDLGGKTVELLYFGRRAHTGGDTIIYLPQEKILFAGGLTPNRFFPIMPDKDSSGRGWIATLEQMEKMDVERIVPGHGEISDQSLIRTIKTYLLELGARVEQLQAGKRPLAEIQSILFAEFTAAYPDWSDAFWIKNTAEIFYHEGE